MTSPPSSAIAATIAPAEPAVISFIWIPPSLPSPGWGEGKMGLAQRVARRLRGGVRPSEPEEEVADLLDDLRVTGRRPAGEAPEDGQHEVRGGVSEDCVAALEVPLVGLRLPLPVLDRDAPAAAPGAGDLDPVDAVDPLCRVLVDGVLHDDVAVRDQHPGRRLVDLGQLVAQPVLDVVGVDPVVHDV